MADCERLPHCIFIKEKLAKTPDSLEIFIERYCQGDYSKCARHKVFRTIGKEAVPEDLYPFETERAEAIIYKIKLINCWEFKKCGREQGGSNAKNLGICPAYPDNGRNCAIIAGTLCEGKVQGTFAAKLTECVHCDFFNSYHYKK